MGQRKVSILDNAAEEVAHVAYFIESKGFPKAAKKFIADSFKFFEKLGDTRLEHRPCKHKVWANEGYRCATFRKKYIVAYLANADEIIICDFALQKILPSY